MLLLLAPHVLTLVPNPLHKSSLPGNVNFDPLGFAKIDLSFSPGLRSPDEILFKYREAELKHSRLAMLAAVAYPVQEKVSPFLAEKFLLPNLLPQGNLSPSLVNGGLSKEVILFLIGIGAGLELYQMNQETEYPADYNWRVGVGQDPNTFLKMQEGEIWNGRLAMLAVLGYTIQELTTKMPVLYFLER